MSIEARVYTREEFHDLIWSEPTAALGDRLGLTEKQLVKTCHDHLIPVPPKRYWAQIAAGETAKKTPLRGVENPALQSVTVGSQPSKFSAYAASLITKAHLALEGRGPPPPRKPDRKQPASRAPRREPAAIPARFLEPILRLHPLAREISEGLRNPPGPKGDVAVGTIEVSPASVDRLERFLHLLFTELETAKCVVKASDQALTIELDNDRVRIEVTEERRRHKYVPTQQEIDALERARERSRRSNWENWPDPLPQYYYEHTGKLTFDLFGSGWAPSLRGKWADGRVQSLESLFDDIVSGIRLRLEYEKGNAKRKRNAKSGGPSLPSVVNSPLGE